MKALFFGLVLLASSQTFADDNCANFQARLLALGNQGQLPKFVLTQYTNNGFVSIPVASMNMDNPIYEGMRSGRAPGVTLPARFLQETGANYHSFDGKIAFKASMNLVLVTPFKVTFRNLITGLPVLEATSVYCNSASNTIFGKLVGRNFYTIGVKVP